MTLRTGIGYDVHRLGAGRRLVLGGVEVPHETGLIGHSDADVLLHAICDALLGAAALGDIGQLFPDNDPQYKDIDSTILLRRVAQRLLDNGWKIGNIDSVVIAQRPKLAPYIPLMRSTIASVLGTGEECISVKATTTEHLGFEGREEGIAALATVTITQ